MPCCDKILSAAKTVTPCECNEPGFCKRHNCEKVSHFHHLCQTHLEYFDQYERGEGPGQSLPPPKFVIGLGDAAEWIIAKAVRDEQRRTELGIQLDRFIELATRGKFKTKNDGTCNCAARKAWLNRFRFWPIRWPWRRNARQ